MSEINKTSEGNLPVLADTSDWMDLITRKRESANMVKNAWPFMNVIPVDFML